MRGVLLDTHSWAWSFSNRKRLSKTAMATLETATTVHVATASLYEIGYKATRGKWPEMAPAVNQLPDLAAEQGVSIIDLTPAIALHAATRDWDHRDPFDRILASTAELLDLPLVSKDPAFDTLRSIRCIW